MKLKNTRFSGKTLGLVVAPWAHICCKIWGRQLDVKSIYCETFGEKCGGTWYIIFPLFENSGRTRPPPNCAHEWHHCIQCTSHHTSVATLLRRKNPDTQNVQKSQNQTWNVSQRYLHIKSKVICIICIKFSTTSSLFLNILTIFK